RGRVDHSQYQGQGFLRSGKPVLLRAVRPGDKGRLLEMFGRLSPESIYFRFFQARKSVSHEELMRLTELDFHNSAALAVIVPDSVERIAGVGCYVRTAGGQTAEVAFLVEDQYQGQGIGTLLLEHLARIARREGISAFEADVLAYNQKMLDVFTQSGFSLERSLSRGVYRVSFPTAETHESLAAQLARERAAAAKSIRPLLEPASIAVVGASRQAGAVGNALLSNLLEGGFKGKIYPVNPSAKEIAGLPCYPDVAAIGGPVDLAFIAVPAVAVEEALCSCAKAEVKGVIILSAGFAEAGSEGKAAQGRLVDIARSAGIRIVGPNCLGIVSTSVFLNATFAAGMPPAGEIAMMSQSGALGIAMLDKLKELGLGLSSFVSVGNKADVSGNDLLCYWGEDPKTKVIVLYLESFGNPRRFARLAPEIAREKPVLAVKSGRTKAGARAAASHSAALASLDVAADALFEQAGVIRADTLEELFEIASLLSTQGAPRGNRIGVVTNAGGPAILLADACESSGLEIPQLSESVQQKLRAFLPAAAAVANPVDMIASASPEHFEKTIEAVGSDPSVDAVAILYVPLRVTRPEEILSAMARGAGDVPCGKPVVCVVVGNAGDREKIHQGPRGRLPVFEFPESAARALSAAARYEQWRKRPRGDWEELDAISAAAIRKIVDRARSGKDRAWLSPDDLAAVLGLAGIGFAPCRTVSVEEAGEAAKDLGFPLVAKAIAPGVIHKSDVGGVVLGIDSARKAAKAAEQIRGRIEKAGARLEAILLQREVKEGLEFFAGITTDATFGPLVLCGAGGVLVELVGDMIFRLPPVSDTDASEMVRALKSARLLKGYRGAPAGDHAALEKIVRRLSALVLAVPEILEVDLNPIKVLPPGQGAIAVDGRMLVGGPS
ncbi:MAG: GNAT family N-acetyltransferase, partial [Bdellovibrionota bacterium]